MKLKEIKVEKENLEKQFEKSQTPYKIIESDGSDENSIQEHFKIDNGSQERVMILDEDMIEGNTDSPYSSNSNVENNAKIQADSS